MTDVTVEGNVFYHCGSPLIYFNWDEVANPDHQFRNVSFRDNWVFYSTMSSWTDNGEEVQGFHTGAFSIDGGPNMQDGTVEVRDNVFFAARECLVYIKTYMPEYLPDFEGTVMPSSPTVHLFPVCPRPAIGAETPVKALGIC